MAATTVLPRPKAYDDTFWKPISLWLTTTDHKLIGIMYMVTGILSFLIGGIFALIVRLQLAQPNLQVVNAETYNQLISAHGVTMIFFFVTIFLTGIANYMVPIMIGGRDMAFPRVYLLGFWLVPGSILFYYSGFFTGRGLHCALTTVPPPARQVRRQSCARACRRVLYQPLCWFFGKPEVYIMFRPGFGMISEVIPVFARKPIFGYMSMVAALFGIVFLSMTVWAHHMFTVGMNTYVEGFFMLMTMLIAVPTGIKFFNWIATAWWGSIDFTVPIKFVFGFLATFLIGGITGVYLASVPVDTQLHQSYYVVAHLHYVLFGGSVFAIFAGIYYWFPKITGRLLDRKLGEWHFWTTFIGFNGTFLIMHTLGLEGMPRRIATYANASWATTNLIITISSFLIAISVLVFLINIVRSWNHGEIAGNDPWQGNTLEWATTSPPPPYNFQRVPPVRSFMPLKDLRESGELVEEEPALTPT